MSLPYTDNIKILDAVGGTTTSSAYDISKRQQITLQFEATETTVFSVDVSNDGTNWITGIAFLDAKATAMTTFVTSKSVTSAGNEGAIITPGFRLIRVVATPNGGLATCWLQTAG